MKLKNAWLALLLTLPLSILAQTPPLITMAEEPHHHLALHNNYVNVYNAEAAAGDSLLLHRHNHDAVAIAIGEQTVTVGIPGKPDVHTKNADGQVRMQLSGYVHSTRNDGQSAYHTVAIELMQPQTDERNLCGSVLPGMPLNCPDGAAAASPSERSDAGSTSSPHVINLPQFASNQTRVQTVRVPPHQNFKIDNTAQSELLVTLDPASISPASGSGPDELLRAGEFLWFEKGAPARTLKNGSDKEVRFVELTFKPSAPTKHGRPALVSSKRERISTEKTRNTPQPL